MGNQPPQVVGKNIYVPLPMMGGFSDSDRRAKILAAIRGSPQFKNIVPNCDFSKDIEQFTAAIDTWAIEPLRPASLTQYASVWELVTRDGYTFFFMIGSADTGIKSENSRITFSFDNRYRRGYRKTDNGNKITLQV